MNPQLGITFDDLHRYRIADNGELIKRKGKSYRTKASAAIEREFRELFGRDIELADITPDTAAALVASWLKAGLRHKIIKTRMRWFETVAKIGVALNCMEPQDFSGITFNRTHCWDELAEPHSIPDASKMAELAAEHCETLLLDFFSNDYIPARLIGKSAATIRLYKQSIRTFSKWLARPALLGDLQTQTVSEFLQWCLQNTERSAATIEKDRVQLCTLWNFAAKRRWVEDFPDIAAINCPQRAPDAWSDSELVALMDACESAKGTVGRVDSCKFWPALVSVIYDTAERVGAVMQVKRQDIDSDGWITVRGEYRKGQTRDRRYRLRPITIERINAIKVFGQSKVFDWPYTETYIFYKFGKILDAAGLPSNRRSKFHKLRRTTASNFEAAGGNATALLDHTHRRTTRAYLDPRVLREVQPADIVPGIGEKHSKDDEGNHRDGDDSMVDQFRAFLEQQSKGGAS
ncbi:tyrosine-type recombinase/integrase [Rhodopirellula bahusiensis]|nr:site-specific integrase [Rhodopirellula bahusiensis]